MVHKAIVRPPSPNFASGLTTVDIGVPDFGRALGQFETYCATLKSCGLSLTRLEADECYPDSTFVEDTAVLNERCAVICRPGAPSRLGEIEEMSVALSQFYEQLHFIREPGTLDGGDVCHAGNHFFIGISRRTNQNGAQQLVSLLAKFGYTSELIDIRGLTNILHLKSGLAYLGDDYLVATDAVVDQAQFDGYSVIHVPSNNEYAANCVRVNDKVLIAAGYREFEDVLHRLGFSTVALEMSEFQKMDGGLSCLSLRF